MKLRMHLVPFGMSLLMVTASGCSKPNEANPPAQVDASSTSSPANGASATTEPAAKPSDPVDPAAATKEKPSVKSDPARDGEIAAKIGDATITRGQVVAWMNANPGKRSIDALDEMVTMHLFGLEAQKAGFQAPEGVAADDLLALGQAWAKATFMRDEVTEAELVRWFDERRAANRLVVADETLAKQLVASFNAATYKDPREAIRSFGELAREHNIEPMTIAPRRVLFDAAGLSDTGSPAVHETIAKAAFAIENDGEIAGPFALGDEKWVIVQRVALRPKMALDQAPPHLVDRARDGLRSKRANEAMKTRAAEVRRAAAVTVTEAIISDLQPAIRIKRPLGKGGALDTRRMRQERIQGREPNQRLDEVLPPGAEEELRRADPDEVRSKMGGNGAQP